jgi:hypothetical protein
MNQHLKRGRRLKNPTRFDHQAQDSPYTSIGFGGLSSIEVPYWNTHHCVHIEKASSISQRGYQADGGHMSFGKCTLFSAYANTANGSMAPLGFAIMFGNEDSTNRISFWTFIKSVHPIMNQSTKTVITDQDKGSLASIRQILPDAGLFHYAFHCWQNTKKKFGGWEGNTPLTCLRMYNILVKCSSVAAIRSLKQKYEVQMKPAHLAYLSALKDDQQYQEARCDKAHNVCMYGKTASSGVEGMNQANNNVQARTAVDMLNAALILLKKEGILYEQAQSDAQKTSRWSDSHLTPKGMTIMEVIFAKCDPSIYRVQMTDFPDYNQFVLPEGGDGSWFSVWKLFLWIPDEGRHPMRSQGRNN